MSQSPTIPTPPATFDAWTYREYGTADVLHRETLPLGPVPKGHVLVKVHAVSLNSSDREFLHGSPAYTRIWGWKKPKLQVLGTDVSGEVIDIGPGTGGFRRGDRVFGDILVGQGGTGSHAICPAKHLTHKPDWISHHDASVLPQAGAVAIQGLAVNGGIKEGDRVLILGAGGGAGSFAVPLAKRKGAFVTAVDHGDKADFIRAIGADEVWDYRETDFTTQTYKWDYILDLIGVAPLLAARRRLTPGGTFVLVGGPIRRILNTWFTGGLLSLFSSRKSKMCFVQQNGGMQELLDLVQQGEVDLHIHGTYAYDRAPEAYRVLDNLANQGKVVVQVVEEEPGAVG